MYILCGRLSQFKGLFWKALLAIKGFFYSNLIDIKWYLAQASQTADRG